MCPLVSPVCLCFAVSRFFRSLFVFSFTLTASLDVWLLSRSPSIICSRTLSHDVRRRLLRSHSVLLFHLSRRCLGLALSSTLSYLSGCLPVGLALCFLLGHHSEIGSGGSLHRRPSHFTRAGTVKISSVASAVLMVLRRPTSPSHHQQFWLSHR